MKLIKYLGALALAGAGATSAHGQYTLTFNLQEVGSDVVLTAGGAVNLSNWTWTSSVVPTYGASFIDPSTAGVGILNTGDGIYINPIASPFNFGSGPGGASTNFSGDAFYFTSTGATGGGTNYMAFVVSTNYTSGTSLSGSAIFSSQTLSSLGVIPGTYTWNVGSGGTLDTIQIIATTVPEGSGGAVAGFGLAAAGGYQLRRRRRAAVSE